MARKTSFYYSFLVLPADQRHAIIAVWDFCRAVDDAVDETPASGGGAPTGRDAICFWRAELARTFGDGEPETPQGRRLRPFVARFDLPRAAFEDVIDGVAMDLDTTRYETFADLYEYCRRVASAVGMICIQVFGCRTEQAREYALHLGLALQLTNILRDVSDDLHRGRLYLPLEDLRRFGCTVEMLTGGVLTDPVRRLVEFECTRARGFYRQAAEARPPEDRGKLVAAEIMRAVYYETLNRIELAGYDVFSMRARPPRVTQAVIALKQWLWRFLSDPDVIVVGAGFAGLSAAVRLTTRGLRVLVLDGRLRLGGRATAFLDAATGEWVDNGQHVLLGCYRETFAFLRDAGAIDNVRLDGQLSLTMIDRERRRSRLVCPALPSPLHMVAGVMEWEALGWGDRFSMLRMGTPLKLARHPTRVAASPGETVEAWLIRHGQTERIREMLWRPLALAALNQPTHQASAVVFARVLAQIFSDDHRAASVALPTKPLHLMYVEPACAFIRAHGGEVRNGAIARIRVSHDRIESIDVGGESLRPRAVIAAVPWFSFADLFEGRPAALEDVMARAEQMSSCPIVTVNLWCDRPVFDEPFIGLPGRAMQWVFDKRTVWGAGSTHLSLVSSGASALVEMSNEALVALAHDELLDALPAMRATRIVHSRVVRERRATFSLAPGQPPRPTTETAVSGLFLAGDWIDTGLPATIESAVVSGHRAADLVSGNRPIIG